MTLRALRSISCGEEICIPYADVPLLSPHHVRQTQIRSLYHFTCRCTHCTLSPSLTAKSDVAREELRRSVGNSIPTFEEWCSNSGIDDYALIEMHLHALDLLQREGLQVLERSHLDAIAMMYGALGAVPMFRAWAARARDARWSLGLSSGNVGLSDGSEGLEEGGAKLLEFWMERPEQFPVWGWRSRFKRE